MSNHIKSFDSFKKEDSLLEFDFNLGKIFSGAVDFLGPGFGSAVEQKLVEYLLNKLGIKPDTAASMIIQEVVEAIPVEDYASILSGEKMNMKYLSPYFAEAIVDSVKRSGLDPIFLPIAEKLGLDPNGLLVRTVVESFEELGEEELKSRVIQLLGFLSGIKLDSEEYISSLDPETRDRLSKGVGKAMTMQGPLGTKKVAELKKKSGGDSSNWISSLFGAFNKPGAMQDTF